MRESIIRSLTLDEWMGFMKRGEGNWIRFDIAECDGNFVIIERDGKMLAYLQHQPHESQQNWHVINRLETRPYYRRRGYARQLVEWLIGAYQPLTIIARGVQSFSTGFWQHIGFIPDGYGPDIVQGLLYNEGNFVWEKNSAARRSVTSQCLDVNDDALNRIAAL